MFVQQRLCSFFINRESPNAKSNEHYFSRNLGWGCSWGWHYYRSKANFGWANSISKFRVASDSKA